MASTRVVTERDFRRPEFLDADPADYEFREDGAVVRKDRWETGIRQIVSILGMVRKSWEISDVVERIREERALYDEWLEWPMEGCLSLPEDERPEDHVRYQLKLENGSVLNEAIYDYKNRSWMWLDMPVVWHITHWR